MSVGPHSITTRQQVRVFVDVSNDAELGHLFAIGPKLVAHGTARELVVHALKAVVPCAVRPFDDSDIPRDSVIEERVSVSDNDVAFVDVLPVLSHHACVLTFCSRQAGCEQELGRVFLNAWRTFGVAYQIAVHEVTGQVVFECPELDFSIFHPSVVTGYLLA